MYKYLLWDVDGTILDFLASEKCAIKALFEKYKLGVCTDEMIDEYSKINVKYWQKLERGELTKPEILVGRFIEFFSLHGIDKGLSEEFNSEYQVTLGDYVEFVPKAKEVLLSQKGKFTLVAVTNGTKVAQEKKLKLSGLDKIFDYIFISENVGAEKPNKEYFDYVFEKVGICDKKDALIIGDSLTSDMLGGVNAGIDTCWFNPKHEANKLCLEITYEIEDLGKLREIIDKGE